MPYYTKTGRLRICARPHCSEPSVQPHRKRAGLCSQHAQERAARQARSHAQRKCACGNCARLNSSRCGACQERYDERQRYLRRQARIDTLIAERFGDLS